MGKEEEQWVEALLGETYFGACGVHPTLRKNERNVFCANCHIAVCQHCLPSHLNHSLLQIRRYVYHDVIRLHDIEKLVNCEYVQSYIVNSAKVVFLNQRPQSRPAKGVGNACETCDRILQDGWRFCSLACKVDAALKKGAKGGKGIKTIITAPLSSFEKDTDDQLSPNCVFPEPTASSLSPSSSVSTADDGSKFSQAHVSSKCNLADPAMTKLIKSSHSSHMGACVQCSGVELSKLAGSSSPSTSNSIKSLNSVSSPGTLKWARNLKWPAASKFAKRLPFTPYGKLSITSKPPNGHVSHMPLDSSEQGPSHYMCPSPIDDDVKLNFDIVECVHYMVGKRRKSTPRRSPIC